MNDNWLVYKSSCDGESNECLAFNVTEQEARNIIISDECAEGETGFFRRYMNSILVITKKYVYFAERVTAEEIDNCIVEICREVAMETDE